MKIRTILGLLLIIALVVSSTGVAAAEQRDQWQDYEDSEGNEYQIPPSWNTDDGMSPGDGVCIYDGPSWIPES